MMRRKRPVIALWRGVPGEQPTDTRNYSRLGSILEALTDAGIAVEPVLYSEELHDEARARLRRAAGVLVWVDPLAGDRDRANLDALLRDISARGVWVSAHPDAIEKMGTKEVLVRTKSLGWGTDTHLYDTPEEFRHQFPTRLVPGRPRVLKRRRGNGGIGVWKVTLLDQSNARVRVQHAAPRDDTTEELTLAEFMLRCDPYFTTGALIDQPFIERVADGMIRAYVVDGAVVGFARQAPLDSAPRDRVLGLPSAKTMYDADEKTFARLKASLEAEWIPQLRALVGLNNDDMPVLWDADFLLGPPDPSGHDTYVLCEINVSSVLPYPEQAPARLAEAVTRRLGVRT